MGPLEINARVRGGVMKLADVYHDLSFSTGVLYELLKERNETVNISHKSLPSWDEHARFVGSKPYAAWYLLLTENDRIGAIYLTKTNEIGVFIFKQHHGSGFGSLAVRELMGIHPRKRYLANINPLNERSARMFRKLGFGHIQDVYEKVGCGEG
ncbi:MAG: GNAT family N-acetyltransferase [Nitrospirota bacterium]